MSEDDQTVAIVIAIDDCINSAGEQPVSISECLKAVRKAVPECPFNDDRLTDFIVNHALHYRLPILTTNQRLNIDSLDERCIEPRLVVLCFPRGETCLTSLRIHRTGDNAEEPAPLPDEAAQ